METRVYDLKTQYEEGLEQAAAAIREGKLVIFPTETVYGIGADAENIEAVRKIYEVKGRPQNNPLIAHICSMEMVERLAYYGVRAVAGLYATTAASEGGLGITAAECDDIIHLRLEATSLPSSAMMSR